MRNGIIFHFIAQRTPVLWHLKRDTSFADFETKDSKVFQK